MRVSFVSWDKPGPTSAQNVWLRNLLPELRRRGIESQVLFLTVGQPEHCPTVQLLRRQGFKCPATANLGSTHLFVRWILKRLAEDPPDVFSPHNVLPAYYAARWVCESGIPTVGVLHLDDPFCRGLSQRMGYEGSDYCVSAFVAVSSDIAVMARELVSKQVIVKTIPCGVPSDSLRAQVRPDLLRLAYVGRLEEEQKRISDLTRAFCRAAREVAGVEGVIYGDGNARSSVEVILRKEGQGLPVQLMGPIDNEKVRDILAECHVLALLSDYEGTPISVMEAMACGTVPVCLSTTGGMEDLVRDGETGLVVNDRGDDFVAAVRQLRDNPELWQRISRAAKARIDRGFSNDICAAEWEALLKQLHKLAKKKRPIKVPYHLSLPPVLPEFATRDPRKPLYMHPACLARHVTARLFWHLNQKLCSAQNA